MCLSNVKKLNVATKDIKCYKRVFPKHVLIDGYVKYHGKAAKAIINCIEVDGVISINLSDRLFICSNNIHFEGKHCAEKFGYAFFWIFDENVSSIKCGEVELVDAVYKTPYRALSVKIGNTYKSSLIKEHDKVHIGLHSFLNKTHARADGWGTVVECIIPKGSQYYKGMFDEYPSYASTALTYVKTIDV